ncbi:MAG: esterase family protein [Defluviitaleaceae bacterium]|nr:esterase family protein [Defluviitaleaceae bacterium]
MAFIQTTCFSHTLGMHVSVNVLLPQKTKEQMKKRRVNYPTLYLLHGMSDDHTAWTRLTSIERYACQYELAVVMPSTALGFYTDMAMGLKWFSYIADELPFICRQFFPLSDKAEENFAAGLSMGGYGAAKLALSRPDVFSHGATLSGATDMAEMFKERVNEPESEYWKNFWKSIFGDVEKGLKDEDDLLKLADARKADGRMPRLYQWCGTDDFLYKHNVSFRNHLQRLGFDLTYSEETGDHTWGYWDAQIQKVLEWLPLKKLK